MIKTILVPATGTDSDSATYSAAFAVARIFGAHVDALHVAADPLEAAVNLSADAGTLIDHLIDDMKEEIGRRERDAHRIFGAACRGEGIEIAETAKDAAGASAHWHVEVGREDRWIVACGITADLIVASRGQRDADADARTTLEAALLETGRPVLVPSTSGSSQATSERVAIAWKPMPEAARAVAFSLPFLTRAKAVTILTVEEEPCRRADTERLVNYLAWHGVRPSVKRLGDGVHRGPAALAAALTEAHDLLVMGGYGHARLREWAFGGFTRRILEDAPIPVLIAH